MCKIKILGLGPGSFKNMTLETIEQLENSDKLFLRTEIHPLVKEFSKYNIEYQSCDSFYEKGYDFEQVYIMIAEFIINQARKYDTIQYAVPGNPLVLEKTVQLISDKVKGTNIDLEIIPALSSLDSIYSLLGIYPAEGLVVLDALSLPENYFWKGRDTVITQVYSKLVASDLKIDLLEYFPPEYEIKIIKSAGIENQQEVINVELSELDWHEFDHLTSLYLPKISLNDSFEDLIKIVRKLRSENGCLWDKQQTHLSLQKSLLEESYEVIETIQDDNKENMCEELGDLLLQVAFHSVIAEEDFFFTHRDVIKGIVEKMIRRHPHVFGNSVVANTKELLQEWERIKQEENKDKKKSILDNIPKQLPVLLQADKMQEKAARFGFDWEDIDPVWDKVYEELQELRAAEPDRQLDELGDVLFSIVNLARFLNIDSESALFSTIRKFRKRFQFIEKQVENSGREFHDYTIEELDKFWELSKDE